MWKLEKVNTPHSFEDEVKFRQWSTTGMKRSVEEYFLSYVFAPMGFIPRVETHVVPKNMEVMEQHLKNI